MKIYVHSKGITLSGKAWEIREQLKQYGKDFFYVMEWIKSANRSL
ncbi:Z-ring formation inhibitor MciZ [Bacillus sp. FJAT-49736]|nr:Z-ring formation inhibitor MciZ [Bacillus sp. FJAT-49736]MBS4173352.1 Z-ring formation inhibitor MciZ [Bacillus sp. FJAT-49736]